MLWIHGPNAKPGLTPNSVTLHPRGLSHAVAYTDDVVEGQWAARDLAHNHPADAIHNAATTLLHRNGSLAALASTSHLEQPNRVLLALPAKYYRFEHSHQPRSLPGCRTASPRAFPALD